MSLSDHRYTARIAPVSLTSTDAIHEGVIIRDERGQRVNESFASGGLTWPTKSCPVLIDHDERFPIGFVCDFAERDGWNEATFVLNMDKPLADVAQEILRVGTPVSLGAKSLLKDESLADLGLATPVKRYLAAVLQEVSILSPGVVPAYRDAKVIRITERGTALDRVRERQERERTLAKPKLPKPAAALSPVAAAAPAAIVYRKPVSSRDQAEEAEMRRRLDWLEKHTGRYDLEAVVFGMRRELDGPSPDDLAREQGIRP